MLGVLNVREFFEPGAAACGGGIGSSVRSCQDREIEKEREIDRERNRKGLVFQVKRFQEKEVTARGRKAEGNEDVKDERTGGWMDGWIGWMDMGEHFRGTGGR